MIASGLYQHKGEIYFVQNYRTHNFVRTDRHCVRNFLNCMEIVTIRTPLISDIYFLI